MTRLKRTVFLTAVCIILAGFAGAIYALFHGYFDRGQFEIKQTQWSSSGQVAMVAKRSDHQALNSAVYYVLIGDHVFNASELRRAYYSDSPVFAAANDCLRASWNGPQRLLITCHGAIMKPGEIEIQRRQAGNLGITYVDIPLTNAESK